MSFILINTYIVTTLVSVVAIMLAERFALFSTEPKYANYTSIHSKLRVLFYLIAFVVPFLVAALRYEVGNDFRSYSWLFLMSGAGHETHMEFGFELLVMLIKLFTQEVQVVFASISFITILLIFLTIKRFSAYCGLSYFLFFSMGFYGNSLSAIRSYIAIAVCFWAIKFLQKNEIIIYLAFVLLAMSFHASAVVMVPFALLARYRFRVSYYIILLVIGLIVSVFGIYLLDALYHVIRPQWRAALYGLRQGGAVVSYFNLMLSGIVALGCAAYYKQLVAKPGNIILVNGAFASFLLYASVSWWLGGWVTRFALFFNIMHILIIPEIILVEKNPHVKCLYMTLVVVAFVMFFFMLFNAHTFPAGNGWFPYRSVFSR